MDQETHRAAHEEQEDDFGAESSLDDPPASAPGEFMSVEFVRSRKELFSPPSLEAEVAVVPLTRPAGYGDLPLDPEAAFRSEVE